MEQTFAKRLESLPQVFDFISRFASTHSIGEERRHVMEFGIEEIFTNMVKYNSESELDISVSLTREGNQFSACLTDRDVHSFDPTDQPPVDVKRPVSERKPGGLGIHLIKELFDDVRYEYKDRTCKITLVANLMDDHA